MYLVDIVDLFSLSLSPLFLIHTQDQIPDREVKNLTSDWNDGTLIAALVDALAPGLCPEHSIMDPKNAQQNASHAMKLAEDWLDVPQVSSYSSKLKGWLISMNDETNLGCLR